MTEAAQLGSKSDSSDKGTVSVVDCCSPLARALSSTASKSDSSERDIVWDESESSSALRALAWCALVIGCTVPVISITSGALLWPAGAFTVSMQAAGVTDWGGVMVDAARCIEGEILPTWWSGLGGKTAPDGGLRDSLGGVAGCEMATA